MLIMQINNLKKYYGDRLILDINDFKMYSDDKIGIVGLNGAGKTTFLDIIASNISPDEGKIDIYADYTYITQFEINQKINVEKKIACEFNIMDKELDHMSGGERTRLKIAQSLSTKFEILMADEPTSNLDLEGIKLLEERLMTQKGALMIISHDRDLLDKLCNKMIEVQDGKIKIYNGNYTSYRHQKDMERQRQLFEYSEYTRKKRLLENAVEDRKQKSKSIKRTPSRMGNSEARLHKMGGQKAKASIDRAVKSIQTRLDKLEVKEKPNKIIKTKFDIREGNDIYSKLVVSAKGISKYFGKRVIFKDSDFDIYRGSKTAILGNNGAGKTTLIKMILNGEEDIRISQNARIGYFSQEIDTLNYSMSILENVMEESHHDERFVRNFLSKLLFKKEDVYKKVDILSGGELVKVSLAKILLSDINMMILDEPTNYLDIYSQEALEEALKEYDGTLIFISHDRRFIKNIADNIMTIEGNSISMFNGSYDEYIESKNSIKEKIDEDLQSKRMILENRLSDIIGRLSIPSKNDDLKELDTEYKNILQELKDLKEKCIQKSKTL